MMSRMFFTNFLRVSSSGISITDIVLRHTHACTVSVAFMIMYAHMIKYMIRNMVAVQYGLTASSGLVTYIVAVAAAFMGYAMVYGNMGHWATVVIIGLLDFVAGLRQILYGELSNPSYISLSRLYCLHWTLGLLVAAGLLVHILVLHQGHKASNATMSFMDTIVKDVMVVTIAITGVMVFIMIRTAYLIHGANDSIVDYGVTPAHIVPEAYLLSVYGALKCIMNKSAGIVVAALLMFSPLFHFYC